MVDPSPGPDEQKGLGEGVQKQGQFGGRAFEARGGLGEPAYSRQCYVEQGVQNRECQKGQPFRGPAKREPYEKTKWKPVSPEISHPY